ncbi:DUF7507 domain-containing protein [Lysinibacter cavernae]|uniref:Putative repeat protein (TIGR01451 family) n=1 Tax=Lysinibacter cavernae TaxID=1640652 RepID=A0A7X5TT23_9MICO|nr:DUF11 domain-containing protein [Lysinibacter cavernae]NIH53695.1 putative repeat protein (TIGR01451 family) [Lysinibacter cavernae]
MRRIAALGAGVAVLAGLAIPSVAQAADPELAYDLAIGSVTTGSGNFDADDGPGNDSGPTNNIVRSFDSVTYELDASVNTTVGATGVASNSTFTFTLPVGMTWNTLPGTCLATGTPASSISSDGRTAVCNIGDIPIGSARTIALSASVANLPNQTPLDFAPDAVSFATDNVTTPAVSVTPDSLVSSGAPNVNMTKLLPYVAKNQLGPDGVTRGWLLQYGVTFSIPDLQGKGRKGYLTPTGPISFTDDFSQISPNAQFVRVETGAVTNHQELPQFSTANLNLPNAINNGGVWTATPDQANQKVTVTVTGADLTANHIPTVSRGGQAITDKGYLTFGKVVIFVPLTDVPVDENGEGTLSISNLVTDFAPTGPQADGSTVPNVGENPADNRQTQDLIRQANGEFSKRFADVINSSNTPYLVEGMVTDRSGNGTLTQGQQVQSFMSLTNTSSDGEYSAATVCDMWDSRYLNLAKYSVTPAARWENPNGNPTSATGPAAARGHFEYLTGFTLTGTDAQRWQQMRSFSCADGAGTWTTQADALANPSFDLTQVTAVRFVADQPIPAGETATMLVNLEAKTAIPEGQIVANMAGWSAPEIGNGVYHFPNYVPETGKTASGFTPSAGDRLTAVRAPLALTKSVTDPVATTPRVVAGGAAQFTITPSFRTVGRPGPFTATDVTVTDRIPAGMSLVLDAGNVDGQAVTPPNFAPTSVTVLPDGTTEVVWTFDELSTGNLPSIVYWVQTESTSRGDFVNTAIIRSPDDSQSPDVTDVAASPTDPHRSSANLGIDGVAGIAVSKTVLNPFISAGDDFSFEITTANGSQAVTQTGSTVIDVFPFIGDGAAGTVSRVPATDNGSQFTLAGEPTVPAGATVDYTTDPSATVQASQTIGSGQGPTFGAGVTWQSFAAVQTHLEDVTAIRVHLPDMPPVSTQKFRYTLTHLDGVEGGYFANNATFRTTPAALGVVSNTVTTRMLPEQPSITLNKSASTPADGEQFEVGETVNYQFVVTNTGVVPLTGVTVDESSFVNGAGDPLSLTTPITVTDPSDFDGTLAPGESATFEASYLVTQADEDAGGQLTNVATTSGNPPTGAPVTDESDVSVSMGDPNPGISLIKRAETEPANGTGFVVGETLEYSFTVRNEGNVTLSDVTVAEGDFTNGAGDSLQLDSGPTAPAGFTGQLSPGEQVVFTGTYTFTQADIDAAGVITNNATASGTDPFGTDVDDDDTVTTSTGTAVSAIELVKSASAAPNGLAFQPGETVTYTFVATNTGAVTLHDVTLDELSFTNGAGSELTLTDGPTASDPSDFDGTLAVGDSVTYTATYLVTKADVAAGGSIANSALVTGTPTVGVPVTDESDVAVNIDDPAPALSLAKTVTNVPVGGSFAVGDTVNYAFTVRNVGNMPLNGVAVNEKSFTNEAGQQLSLTSGPTAADGFSGSLAPGEQTVFTGTYVVTAADRGGNLSNTAVASGETVSGDSVVAESSVLAPVVAGAAPGGLTLTGVSLGGMVAAVLLLMVAGGLLLLRRRRVAASS